MRELNPENWVEEYGDYLYNFAISRLRNSEKAQDAVQDTLLSAWRAREGFAGKASEKTWLTSILRNKIIDIYRKDQKHSAVQSNFNIDKADEDDDNFNKWGIWRTFVDSWANNPEEVVANEEFAETFHKCSKKLPEKMHRLFTMKYLDHLDTDEICEVMDLSPSNYWTMLYRIRTKLRNCLQKNWYRKQ